eukprot:TRINITY_DN9562_c0_g1_i5.p1 TRINITY_DN9562_c0_g1~~TRINITY_DN9562_c0_g1_i5.p1  ORF type:complete len:368 (-),score=87.15 TRINITY_DN9562_c0_g1_i5:29-1132(-)
MRSKRKSNVENMDCFNEKAVQSPVRDEEADQAESVVPFSPDEKLNTSSNEASVEEDARCGEFEVDGARSERRNEELERKVLELEKIVMTAKGYVSQQDEFKRRMKEKKLRIKSSVACRKIQKAFRLFVFKKKLSNFKVLQIIRHKIVLRKLVKAIISWYYKFKQNRCATFIQRVYRKYLRIKDSRCKKEARRARLLKSVMEINTSAEIYSRHDRQVGIKTLKKIDFANKVEKVPCGAQSKACGDVDDLLSEESVHSEDLDEVSQDGALITRINGANEVLHCNARIQSSHSRADNKIFKTFRKRGITEASTEYGARTNRDNYILPDSNKRFDRNFVMWKSGRIEPKDIEDQELPSPEHFNSTTSSPTP